MKSCQRAYLAYGLRLTSDRAIPGLTPGDVQSLEMADLHVRFDGVDSRGERDRSGETLWYTSEFRDENGDPSLKIWKGISEGDFFVRYSHGLTFCLRSALKQIDVHCTKQTNEDVALYLLGPVLGLLLRLRGWTCLHASAVNIEGKAVLFAGDIGSGKSTTAAIFAQNGHAVLTDDIVPLKKRDGHFYVLPGYPYLNLLPDSMTLLSGAAKPLPSPEPVTEKHKWILDEKGQQFQNEALPLGAIYVLAGRSPENSATVIESFSPREALIALATHSYANKILDAEMRANEFALLGEIVKIVPVRKLLATGKSRDVSALYRVISSDAASIMGSRVA